MNKKGFIMIDRSILEDDMYFSEKFTRMQAYMDLCLLAAFKSRTFYIRGNKVELQPMQVAKSVRDLADRWQWGINKVRSFILELEKSGIIDTQKTSVIQIITIKKYIVVNTQNDTPIIKNNKENKENKEVVIESIVAQPQQTPTQPKERKKRSSSTFVKPTFEECMAYAQEKGYQWNIERFFNYYESNGWRVGQNPMKNWKAAMRTWNTKEPQYSQPNLFPTTTSINNNGLTQYNNGTVQQQFGGTQSYYTKESEQRVLGMGQRGFDRAFQAAMRDIEQKYEQQNGVDGDTEQI